MAVDIFSKAYLTDEERKEPFWNRGEHFEFFTSYDPNKLGLHCVPLSKEMDIQLRGVSKPRIITLLMHDVCTFTMYWWGQVNGRLNGFMFQPKIVLHDYGWQPIDGYDKKIFLPPLLQ